MAKPHATQPSPGHAVGSQVDERRSGTALPAHEPPSMRSHPSDSAATGGPSAGHPSGDPAATGGPSAGQPSGNPAATGAPSAGHPSDNARVPLQHPIAPVCDERSEVLVLGSFPSPASREQGFFYGHPQNRMWRVLARLFDEPVPSTVERRRDFLVRHHIAMWDVLASCRICGASDASIADEQPNDIAPLLGAAPIKAIYCAGKTAARLYAKHIEPVVGRPCVAMPSTSPANATRSEDALVEAWAPLRREVTDDGPVVLDVPEVVALEQAIARAGTSLAELMDRAGTWLAYRAHVHDARARACVLAGNGNNGGDGWVAARELTRWGHEVVLASARPAEQIEAQPAHDAAMQAVGELERLGARVLVAPGDENLAAALAGADIVIDAILGTGFAHDQVRAPFDSWIRAANEARERGAYLLAADCPSGLNAQTGAAASPHIQADETLTMICSKTGLQTPQGADACGTLSVAALCDLRSFLS